MYYPQVSPPPWLATKKNTPMSVNSSSFDRPPQFEIDDDDGLIHKINSLPCSIDANTATSSQSITHPCLSELRCHSDHLACSHHACWQVGAARWPCPESPAHSAPRLDISNHIPLPNLSDFHSAWPTLRKRPHLSSPVKKPNRRGKRDSNPTRRSGGGSAR